MQGIFDRNSSRRGCACLGRTGLLLFAAAVATAGCSSFQPRLDERATFLQRTIHQENKRFRVSVAVPSPEEAAQLFDRGLHKEGIQPVWLRIENRLATTAYFLPNLIDSDYYAPLEVAYQYHSGWRPKRNAAMDAFFLTHSMPDRIPPGTERSGFVFTHLDLGKKQVCVSISSNPGAWHDDRYTFVVDVPGLQTEYQQGNWVRAAEGWELIECDDERLRAELEKLPRATTDKAGQRKRVIP